MARSLFHGPKPNPVGAAALAAVDARDDLVYCALELAGLVRSTHDEQQVGDGLVSLVLVAERYVQLSQALTAIRAEHDES